MQKNNANSNNKKNSNSSDLTAKYKEEMMQQYKRSKMPQNTIPAPALPSIPNNKPTPPSQNKPKPPQNMPKPPQNLPKPPQNNIPTPSQAIEKPIEIVQNIVPEKAKTPEIKPEVIVVPELILPERKCEDRPARTLEELNNPPMPKISVSVRDEVEKTNEEHLIANNQVPSDLSPAPNARAIELDAQGVDITPISAELENTDFGLKFPTAEEILLAETGEKPTPKPTPKPDVACKKSGTKIISQNEHQQGNYETTSQIATPTQTISQQEVKCGFTSDKSLLPKGRKCEFGYLAVEVMTAADNVPVENATVIITEILVENYKKDVIATLFTDAFGETVAIELATNKEPKTIYSVSVFANGYVPVRAIEVPIYKDVKSIQPISLVAIDDSKG